MRAIKFTFSLQDSSGKVALDLVLIYDAELSDISGLRILYLLNHLLFRKSLRLSCYKLCLLQSVKIWIRSNG